MKDGPNPCNEIVLPGVYQSSIMTLDEVRESMGLDRTMYQCMCEYCKTMNHWTREELDLIHLNGNGAMAVTCQHCRRLHVLSVQLNPADVGYIVKWKLVSTAQPTVDEREPEWVV